MSCARESVYPGKSGGESMTECYSSLSISLKSSLSRVGSNGVSWGREKKHCVKSRYFGLENVNP